MKGDVKKFSEKYYEEILKLPRKDLGKNPLSKTVECDEEHIFPG